MMKDNLTLYQLSSGSRFSASLDARLFDALRKAAIALIEFSEGEKISFLPTIYIISADVPLPFYERLLQPRPEKL